MEQITNSQNINNIQQKSQSNFFFNQRIALKDSFVEQKDIFTVNIMKKKSKFQQMELNPDNPEDRALSLSIKMMKQQKMRQEKQKKMIDDIRLHQLSRSFQMGQISRMIVNQQFIGKHQYLRENLYKKDHIRINIFYRSPQQNSNNKIKKKEIFQKSIQILQKSKFFNKNNQCRKIVKDIFYNLVDKIVQLIQKKKAFTKNSPKRRINLIKNLFKQTHQKPQLSLSRVMDIKINNDEEISEELSQQSDKSQENHKSQQNNESQQNSNDESQQNSDEDGQNSDQNKQNSSDNEQDQQQVQKKVQSEDNQAQQVSSDEQNKDS